MRRLKKSPHQPQDPECSDSPQQGITWLQSHPFPGPSSFWSGPPVLPAPKGRRPGSRPLRAFHLLDSPQQGITWLQSHPFPGPSSFWSGPPVLPAPKGRRPGSRPLRAFHLLPLAHSQAPLGPDPGGGNPLRKHQPHGGADTGRRKSGVSWTAQGVSPWLTGGPSSPLVLLGPRNPPSIGAHRTG